MAKFQYNSQKLKFNKFKSYEESDNIEELFEQENIHLNENKTKFKSYESSKDMNEHLISQKYPVGKKYDKYVNVSK